MKNFIPSFIAKKALSNELSGNFQAYSIFIDISGFTSMTQALMTHGKEGAEILSNIINNIFTPSIEAIDLNGGFVTSFAGDAFTAVFETDKAEYPLKAAYDIHNIFTESGKVITKFGEFDLAVKIGLSFGEVEYGIIEAEVQKTFYFRGEAIDACATSEHHADKMQIIADDRFISKFDADLEKKPVGKKWFLLIPTSLEISQLKQKNNHNITDDIEKEFIPFSVLELKERGEFREIVSVFISFAEEGEYIESIKNVIRKTHSYGGYFNKIDFGDKGGVMLIIFGAPSGREKLYQRALDFTLSLRNIPNFKFRAGISRGIAYCGIVGSKLRREYTALGSVVNLSARLMMKADWSEILTGSKLADNLNEHYVFESKGETEFKGFSDKIEVYNLKSKNTIKQQISYSGSLVGRVKELKKLNEFIKPIFDNKFGGIVYIDGPAGIGKSRLISDFALSVQNCNSFLLPCDEILKRSFNPFEYFFKHYFEQSPSKTKEENKLVFKKVYKNLVDNTKNNQTKKELQRTETVLGALIGLEWENSFFTQLDPRSRYENTLYSVKNFFLAQSLIRPIILIFEDVHWIDSDSLAILEVIVRNIKKFPIVILALCRMNDDGTEFDLFKSIENECEVQRMRLETINKSMMNKLIIDKLNVLSMPESTLDFIWDKSGGNPFFVEQLVLFLSENDFLDNEYNLSAVSRTIPNGISQIIIARIDRLSSKMKKTVKTASVLGREFALNVLTKMLNINYTGESGILNSEIAEGTREQIWENISELNYIFKHALIRDTVYEIQLKDSLRKLHNLAGNITEELYDNILSEYYEILANHYDKAENKDKAVDYFEKSGNQARDNFQNEKAIHLYDKLLQYLGKDQVDKTVRILLEKGEIIELTGKWDDALNIYQKALKLADKTDDQTLKVDSMISLGYLLNVKAKTKEAKVLFDKALKIATKLDYKNGIAGTFNAIGALLVNTGNYDEAIKNYKKSLKIKQEIDDKKGVSTTFGNMGGVFHSKGNHSEAMKCYKKQLKISEKLEDKALICRAISNIGIVYYYQMDYNKAIEFYKRSMTIFEELGDKRALSATVGNIGIVYSSLGDLDKAIGFYQSALNIKKELGDKRSYCSIISNMGVIYADKGEYKEAMECYLESLNIATKLDYKRQICITTGNLGNIYLNKKDYSKSVEYYNKAIEIGREHGMKYYLCSFYTNKAEMLFDTGRKKEAKILNVEALKTAIETGRKDMVLRANILNCKLKNNLEGMKLLLDNKDLGKEDIASIYFELWNLTKSNDYKNKAIDAFKKLLFETPKQCFRLRIQEMENSKT
ncbi:MAG: tetratricopeptide repeat protein [Candidatus Delongbacteria bacterium]|jgi:tetratricopeptide (TPR) repeat protein/class 3 adenylate cyclase|nr:tetratricopeptide repeat protein [Candidatus Delongbacteria bacterium]